MSLRLNKYDKNFVFISVFISNYITHKKKTIILVSRTGFQSFPNEYGSAKTSYGINLKLKRLDKTNL